MTNLPASLVNHQVRLAARPLGLPRPGDWQFTEEPVRAPAEGGMLVEVLAISLDPAMRGWMNEGRSYIAPVGLGEVMRAGGVGRVLASRHPDFAAGDLVAGGTGVQEFWSVAGEELSRARPTKIDLRLGRIGQWLNVLGMPGMTAYFGLLEVGRPQAGQTLVVSAAAGAVGQTVGQLAKIKGLRVVGIAGGPAKCEWVVGELGFDACIDYKAAAPAGAERRDAVREGLAQHCPNGVDIYFDNVGGEILDTVLPRMNTFGRIPVCGLISQYNATEPYGVKNFRAILVQRLQVRGFIIFDFMERYGAARADLAQWLAEGKLRHHETVAEGLRAAPAAFLGMLRGANLGKQLVKLA